MKHPSLYLTWYVQVTKALKVKFDLRSSGISGFKHNLMLGEFDLSVNFEHGNPEARKLLAQRYQVNSESIFTSSEGTSGQNARIIRYLAEKNPKKNEAIVEYPTYEPLLRLVQEYFPRVKRLERREKEGYRVEADRLRKIVSEKTGLLVLTNPHLPSGTVSGASELNEVMSAAGEHGFHVLCDEIYAEFSRNAVPTVFSVDPDLGIVTTSFTKAYGLGGLRLGIAIARRELVDELYIDTLNTIGTDSNIVELVAVKLLTEGGGALERHKQKWARLKVETERWLDQGGFDYFPNRFGVTYWVRLPVKDTYKWVNEHAIPRYGLATVPGAFFLFKDDYRLVKSSMIRLGLGYINPDKSNLPEAFEALEKAVGTYKSA